MTGITAVPTIHTSLHRHVPDSSATGTIQNSNNSKTASCLLLISADEKEIHSSILQFNSTTTHNPTVIFAERSCL
ncbi:hypothetical protein K469DRAFT_16552 [Zopfia rhizophila CBS 207.26]|uniref:Uncharacterized protein n=1 Tax=Zopfia rhizophila CBS 207.26 TaxID=1314779 RepID=A0A6A6EZZ6_9PEZI|nr:hypothetical protein K469DRAFT_16552 [Zopfia rhizophila CBS 207.26]